MTLDSTLQATEKLLSKVGLPAGPDSLLNHKTILGFFAGIVGALCGWFITDPLTEEFPFWRDVYVLSGVGFFICLFIVSAESLLDWDLGAVLRSVGISAVYTIIFIVPTVVAAKIFFAKPIEIRPEVTNVFVLDLSGSMEGKPLDAAKKALHAYVDIVERQGAGGHIKLACIVFGNSADIVSNPTTDYTWFKQQIAGLSAKGSTNMFAALKYAKEVLGSCSHSCRIILITDGKPDDSSSVRSILSFFEQRGIPINTVGAGKEYDRPLLEEIAAKTNGTFAPAEDITSLVPIMRRFAERGLAKAYEDPSKKLPFVSRMLGWGSIGVAIGFCCGLLAGPSKRLLFGFIPVPRISLRAILFAVLGGLCGGILGATLFEGLQYGFHRIEITSGILYRLIGFTILGGCTGFFVNFVQAAAKKAWIRITRGRGEGRLLVLDRSPMILGRSELVDLPVFGDLQIEEQNLVFTISGKAAKVETLGDLRNLKVNGVRTRQANLSHRDSFSLGDTEFIFLNKLESLKSMP